MKKHQFENITGKQICVLTIIHRTTFYTLFHEKYDLLSCAMQQIADEKFKNLVDASFSPSDNFGELFSLAIKHKTLFSHLLAEERDSLRNLLRREMGTGIKKYLVEHNLIEEISIDMQIKIEAYIGAVLGVGTWLIKDKMLIDHGELYTKMNIFSE